ncbi:class I SAM-dependent methyltransferase [Lewinella sp. W8]|uniref:class I SAM-dependent methyltransferase n=1 Tax=Lewinella sp. W8 TaxID=2528208 RepID=UPI0010678167|nr:methyltransferase domain-containing protein [Lewinella sp. W8]
MSDLPSGQLLPAPISWRRDIPLYYNKTAAEYRADVYERYDELVSRQMALHLTDELRGDYPFQPVLDYVLRQLPDQDRAALTDVGCSLGRIAAEIAQRKPGWDVYGLDFSYQMLRHAHDYWKKGVTLTPHLARYGWENPSLSGPQVTNLHFALASGQDLPFADETLDVVINTFLLDRLPNPARGLAEWRRVLRPGGKLIMVTPLNFLSPDGWRNWNPPVKLLEHLLQQGWTLEDWVDPLEVREPMDERGNAVVWQTVAGVFTKDGQ